MTEQHSKTDGGSISYSSLQFKRKINVPAAWKKVASSRAYGAPPSSPPGSCSLSYIQLSVEQRVHIEDRTFHPFQGLQLRLLQKGKYHLRGLKGTIKILEEWEMIKPPSSDASSFLASERTQPNTSKGRRGRRSPSRLSMISSTQYKKTRIHWLKWKNLKGIQVGEAEIYHL